MGTEEEATAMIRLIDIQGDPIWLKPAQIDAIGLSGMHNTKTGKESSKIVWHSGSSCMALYIREDLDDVKAAALQAGLVSEEEAGALDVQGILGLVCRSGVTTSPIITDLSGRGLGLAIVRERVEELGGTLSVETQPGAGTSFRILLPLAKPAVGSIALLVFIRSWNDFIIASVMVDKIYLRPIQVSIYNYMGYYGLEWGPLTASMVLAIVPILIAFTILGKLFVSGLTQGSVKN